MGASITIDINAKVQGYQAAIEKMKAEFAKIDPGSDIGKKLAKALSAADSQVKNLSRNLFPKASSDTQIDAIIDKVNRVGESVLQVSQLMQSVGTTDLNFSALGSDVEELRSKIASLQSDLESKLGQGILEAAKSSEQLRSVLEGILGIDLDKISGKDLFSAVEKGALKAAKEVENANAAVQKAQDNINASKTKVSNLENGLLGTFASKENMQQQVRELESQYTDAVSDLRDKISSALAQKFAEGGNFNSEELLNSFFQGLTPETLESKIKELFSALSNAGVYKEKGDLQNFYQDFFGEFKNINQVIKNIDLSALEAVMTKFKELIQTTKGEIGSANEQSITSLINTGMIEQAGKETSAAFTKAFRLIRNTIDTEQKKTVEKLEPQYQAALQQQADAIQRQTAVDTARTNLNTEVTQLREQLSKQQEEINQLREQLNQLAKGKLTNLKTSGGIAGGEAAENMFPSGAAQKYQEQLHRVEVAEQAIGKIKGVSQRWFSVYAVVRMVTNAIKKAIATIKELDDTITEIAIVTNMTQSELWGQMSSYSSLADKYAASISGVYKVSQLYYQQGLQQAEVMELTEQTLKMARISGLDYAEATDYMTNAVRSFKMEMSEAQTVVDVYSAVAASSATSVTELASAMSKTASSAQAVGSSFQNTTAMLAVMIEATRESPENIGSAMKSIISRYGELKENKTGIDSEGEEYSLNKVDKALQSIGISIHDVNGEFKDFDDVIFELASKWDTVDKNTQRYIATVMAGNRQQSRFLALVSSGQRLQEMSSTAENSEDAAQLQYLKVLDSITAKTQNLQNALQSLYLNSGFEQLNKDLLDFGTGVIKVFSSMNQWAGKPIPAILAIGSTFYNVANIATAAFQFLSTRLHARAEILKGKLIQTTQQGASTRYVITVDENNRIAKIWDQQAQKYLSYQERLNLLTEQGENTRVGIVERHRRSDRHNNKTESVFSNSKVQTGISLGASALSLVGTTISANLQNAGNKKAAGLVGIGSSALSGVAMGAAGGLPGMIIGGLAGGVMGLFQNWGNLFQSAEEKLKDLQEEAEKANNEYLQKKSETTDLDKQIKQLKELEKHRYDSVEAEEAYYEAANKMGETYPELISAMDKAGNVTIDLFNAENELTKSRNEAIKAARMAAVKNFKSAQQGVTNAKVDATEEFGSKKDLLGYFTSDNMGMNEYIADYVAFKRYQKMGLTGVMPFEQAKNSKAYSAELYTSVLPEDFYWDFSDLPQLSYFETGNDRSSYNPIDSYFYNQNDFPLLQKRLEELEQSLSSITDEAEKQSYKILIDITKKAFENPLSINEQDFNNFQLIDDSYFTGMENFMYAAAKFGFQKFQKETQGIRQAEATMSSTMESELAKVIGASSIGSKNTFQEQLINSSGILTNLAMNELKNRAVNGEITEELWTNMVGSADGETEGDIDDLLFQWNEELELAWSKLTTSKKDQINNLLKNANRYSSAQLKTELQNIGFEINENIAQAIINNAQSKLYDIEKFQQKFDDRITQRDEAEKTSFDSIFEALKTGFGPTGNWNFGSAELEAMADLQDEIDNYVDNDKMSIEQANGFFADYVQILQSIDNLPTELREKAQKLFFDNKNWSITGLYELADAMANIGIDGNVLDEIRGLSNYVPKNLVADLDSFTNSITSKFEDFQKALKNASDGMDLKDALKFVDKLGMSLNDLDFKNGKFYTKHDFTPEDVEKAYLNWNNKLYQQLESDYNALAGENGALRTYIVENQEESVFDYIKEIQKSGASRKEQIEQFKMYYSTTDKNKVKNAEAIFNLYDQYYDAWDKDVSEDKGTFNEYVLKQLTQSYENAQAALQTASEYEVNSFLLRNGGISAFIDQLNNKYKEDSNNELSSDQKAKLEAAIRKGDLTSLQDDAILWPYVKQYVDVVSDAFKDVQKQLGEALLASFEDGGPKTIEVTKENLEVLTSYKDLFTNYDANVDETKKLKEGAILEFKDIQDFKDDNTLFNNYILAISDTQKDALENLQKYHKALYGTKFKDISNLLDETTSIGYDEFTNYLASVGDLVITNNDGSKTIVSDANLAEKYGVEISKLTGDFIIKNLDTYIAGLQKDLGTLNDSNSSVQERNEIKAKIASARSQQVASQKKAIEDILKSYDSISVEQRKAFADAFKADFDADALNKIFKDNGDGTSKIDVNELQKYLKIYGDKIPSVVRNYFNELIAKIADDYLAKIETAASYIVKGTTKQEDMVKIVSEFNKRYNAGATISSLFKWDDILEAFTFKPEYLQYYIQMQREELLGQGFDQNFVDTYINNQIKQITNAVDITGFYSSENRGVGSKSRQTLRNQISAALFAQNRVNDEDIRKILTDKYIKDNPYVIKSEDINSYINKTGQAINSVEDRYVADAMAAQAKEDNANYKTKLEEYISENFIATQKQMNNEIVNTLIQQIESGGQTAIEAMKTLYQGQELSAEQVEAAYRAQLNNFSNAFDAIEGLSINSVVDQNTREILNQIDGFVVSSDGVVLAVGNMFDAYNQLYENMKRTAVATTAELNNAYAKYLTAQDQKEIDAIEAISNASGMTYEAFGNMLTQYGFSLEQAIKNQAALGIEQTGTGKIRITDFTKLAAAMGWEPNSEEYTDALKSYNDYLIEFNTKTKDAIKNEFESLTTAKGGDWLNLTNLFKGLGDELTPQVEEQLQKAGAVFSDGILKTTTNANFLEIAKILSDAAINAGQELSNEFKDMIESIIKAYSDSIIKGIKGSLTNVEAGNLINQAKNLGIELDESSFIKTEEGLKLAQDKAIELYYALQKVDAIQAHLVFKELNDSLEKSNEHYKSIATIQAHIVELQNKITEADAKTNPARKKQYEEELKLAKEIAQIRLTTEDSSFDFMSTPLNGAFKNAPTYWEAWAKAVSVVEDANKNKYMGWEDFAHLIQGVQDLAVQTGKDMEFMGVTFNKQGTTAGELIEQGYSALKVDPESKQTVLDLGNLMSATGLRFDQGADGFKKGVQEGVREYARGQVDMLDSMIQMLETVVAMEKLGDIAGEDNEIEISDILPKIDLDDKGKVSYAEFGEKYGEIVTELQNLLKTNKDFAAGAKQFKINNISFEEIIGMSPEKLASQSTSFLEAYVAAIKAFVEAGGDWDTAFDLLQEKLLSLNLADGTEFEFGGITYYYKDNIALEKKGEKFVVNGQEFDNADAAIQALKTDEAEAASSLKSTSSTHDDKGGLDLTFGEDLHVKLTYNGDVGYTAEITGGPIITSGTKEGINLGILSWAKNQAIPIDDTKIPADKKVIKFTVEGVTYSVDTQGEVTLEGNESKYHLKDSIEQAYQESIPKEVETETTTDMTVNVTNLTINPQNVKVDTEGTENGTNLNDLTAIITSFTTTKDPNELVNALTAIIIKYDDSTADKSNLVSALTAIISAYDDSTADTSVLVSALTAIITAYTDENADTSGLVNALTAYISEYNDENATKPTLEDLTQFINDINTVGADAALEIWRAKQEVNDINIPVKIIPEPPKDFSEYPNADMPIEQATGILQKVQNDYFNPEGADFNLQEISLQVGIDKSQLINAWTLVQDYLGRDLPLDIDGNINFNAIETQITNWLNGQDEELSIAIGAKTEDATNSIDKTGKDVEKTTYKINVDANTEPAINTIKNLQLPEKVVNVRANYIDSEATGTNQATGTVGLAKAQGTLMGELGPELYVQNGRYFVAGQNGPEFVDLAPDAIVFNHLQTRSLLDKGMSPGRGKAITNERNAVSYAKGNVNGGPAMASAASALAELKKLRAQWQALAGMSVADLAGKGGGGGGGGDKDLPGFIRDVERWYNWLQKIADLEKQITYQEQLRSKIQSDMVPSGKAYYASLKQTYDDAKDSALTSQSLFLSQKETFNKRREQLNNSPLSELYTFDETGQLHYQEGSFNWLAQLFKTDDFGQLALSPQQQYEMILSRNPEFAQYMKYNSEGKEIKQEDYKDNKDQYYLDMVKAFSDRMDAEKEEMQNLFDSQNDQQKAVLEQMQKMNEQLQAMKDNQKEVEESVLKAIVESRERQIKEMEDTKNALQKTNQDFIDGLSKQLDKEQKMYQNNEKDQELQRNRRQLAILQRSGGSASQISSLQKQIEQQSRDQYFEKQQEQIDAVKEASDLQIERLDHQIEIEQEALEYQKANGLLWSEVYNVMKETPEKITSFITSNTADFWSKSPLTKTEDANELIFKAEQWTEFRDDEKMQKAAMGRIDQNLEIFLAALEQIYGDQANWEEIKAKATEDYNKYYGIDNNDPNKAAWDSYPGKNDIETKNTGKQTTGAANITTDTNDKNKYNNDNEVNPATIYASWSYDEKTHWKKAKTYSGKDIKVLEAKHTFPGAITNGSKCSVCGYKLSYYSPISNATTDNKVEETKIDTTVDTNTNTTNKTKQKNNSTPTKIILDKKKLLMYDALNKAANGGIVDQSGAAIIHDNEVILTAEQTRFLRDDILSNKSTSLLGILSSLHSSYKDISANTVNNSEGNVIIENATVQMNIQKIADDYDARRAGDQAMEEMLRIARKSGTRSV